MATTPQDDHRELEELCAAAQLEMRSGGKPLPEGCERPARALITKMHALTQAESDLDAFNRSILSMVSRLEGHVKSHVVMADWYSGVKQEIEGRVKKGKLTPQEGEIEKYLKMTTAVDEDFRKRMAESEKKVADAEQKLTTLDERLRSIRTTTVRPLFRGLKSLYKFYTRTGETDPEFRKRLGVAIGENNVDWTLRIANDYTDGVEIDDGAATKIMPLRDLQSAARKKEQQVSIYEPLTKFVHEETFMLTRSFATGVQKKDAEQKLLRSTVGEMLFDQARIVYQMYKGLKKDEKVEERLKELLGDKIFNYIKGLPLEQTLRIKSDAAQKLYDDHGVELTNLLSSATLQGIKMYTERMIPISEAKKQLEIALEERRKQYEASNDQKRKELKQLMDDLGAKEQRLEIVEKELAESCAKSGSKPSDDSALVKKVEDERDDYRNQVELLGKKVSSLEEDKSTLERQLLTYENREDATAQQVGQMREEHEAARRDGYETVENLRKELDRVISERDAAQKQLDLYNKNFGSRVDEETTVRTADLENRIAASAQRVQIVEYALAKAARDFEAVENHAVADDIYTRIISLTADADLKSQYLANRGVARINAGKRDEGKADLEQSYQLNPDDKVRTILDSLSLKSS